MCRNLNFDFVNAYAFPLESKFQCLWSLFLGKELTLSTKDEKGKTEEIKAIFRPH